ncbi:hypothetical protein MTR_1g056930 [Medicago truncatula]|uniref:Uncharacterized protein n=1 Tax=Medicago truncatula TaxID=3880 RepID=A0A072VJE2_MEDTR|nr:hypothetical protein MTR_1g056930 [Medicago truncatula]
MFDLSRILRINVLGIPEDEALVAALSTTTIKRGGDLKQTSTSTRLVAADLVLPQPVPICLKFSSDGEKREFSTYGVLGTIASFILDDH